MTELYSQSTQDYLKHIYTLTENGETAGTNELASRLNVTAASVSEMLKRLSNHTPPLVDYKKYQGVILTEEGKRIALETIRRHRLLETFLVEILGYSWDNIHEEACRLEHVISDEFEKRIAQVLNNPSFTPHGDPIPGQDMVFPQQITRPLRAMNQGESAVVQRVLDDDSALLRYLSDHGITPQSHIKILTRSAFDDNLTIRVEGHNETIVLGPVITTKIFVSR